MSPAEMIAELIEEQTADDQAPRIWNREVQASRFESEELPSLFDAMPDPSADTVGEAIAAESLARWEAKGSGEWIPDRARETVGVGLVGWALETEGAALLGRVCPCCGGRPGPGRVCLGCCKGGGRLDGFLERLRRLDSDLPESWRSIETEPEKAAVLAEHDRQEQSLAERRWSGREARRASQGPPRAKPERPGRVLMVDATGQAREVRASMVMAYQSSGWRVA